MDMMPAPDPNPTSFNADIEKCQLTVLMSQVYGTILFLC